jgi:hypothetical protein
LARQAALARAALENQPEAIENQNRIGTDSADGFDGLDPASVPAIVNIHSENIQTDGPCVQNRSQVTKQ